MNPLGLICKSVTQELNVQQRTNIVNGAAGLLARRLAQSLLMMCHSRPDQGPVKVHSAQLEFWNSDHAKLTFAHQVINILVHVDAIRETFDLSLLECPEFVTRYIERDNYDDIEMRAVFAMRKAEVSYGNLVKQELKLEPVDEFYGGMSVRYKELIWHSQDFDTSGMSSDKSVHQLILQAAYQPVIRVYTEIIVEPKDLHQTAHRASTLIQECPRAVMKSKCI